MSHPTDDELVDLALGEKVDADRSAHVEQCAVCSASVEQLRRTLRLASGPLAHAGWQAPDDAVWARVTAQIDAEPDTPADAGPAPATVAGPDTGPATTPAETSQPRDERPSGTDADDRHRPTREPDGSPGDGGDGIRPRTRPRGRDGQADHGGRPLVRRADVPRRGAPLSWRPASSSDCSPGGPSGARRQRAVSQVAL